MHRKLCVLATRHRSRQIASFLFSHSLWTKDARPLPCWFRWNWDVSAANGGKVASGKHSRRMLLCITQAKQHVSCSVCVANVCFRMHFAWKIREQGNYFEREKDRRLHGVYTCVLHVHMRGMWNALAKSVSKIHSVYMYKVSGNEHVKYIACNHWILLVDCISRHFSCKHTGLQATLERRWCFRLKSGGKVFLLLCRIAHFLLPPFSLLDTAKMRNIHGIRRNMGFMREIPRVRANTYTHTHYHHLVRTRWREPAKNSTVKSNLTKESQNISACSIVKYHLSTHI